MKSLRKIFTLAPVMLISLTACEAKLSDADAKKRIQSYNAEEVAKNYSTVSVDYDLKVNKKTGVFGKGGLLESLPESLEEAYEQASETYKDQPASVGVITLDIVNSSTNSFSALGLSGEVKLTYYAYQNTGLKIVSESKINEDLEGMKMKASQSGTTYVFDDGRAEKADGKVKMNISGEYGGLKLSGDFEATIAITYTWKK